MRPRRTDGVVANLASQKANRNWPIEVTLVGPGTEVGRSCHTLAFVEQDIGWQIWIDAGPQLTPCKPVITYKTTPAQPRFTPVFTGRGFNPRIAGSVFKPTLPAGTQKIRSKRWPQRSSAQEAAESSFLKMRAAALSFPFCGVRTFVRPVIVIYTAVVYPVFRGKLQQSHIG
jgi:hypothetical protein